MIKNDRLWLLFGDCMTRMKELPDDSIDMICTDPPYGTMVGAKDCYDWDVRLNTRKMMKECHRVLRPNGTMCLFSQGAYTVEISTNNHGNLPLVYRYVWVKNTLGNPLIAPKAPVGMFEDICVYVKADTDHRAHPLQAMMRDELERCGVTREELATRLGSGGVIHHFTTGKVFRFPSERRYRDIGRLTGGFKWDYAEMATVDSEFKSNQRELFPKVFNLPDGSRSKSNVLTYTKDVRCIHPTQKPVEMLEDLITTYTRDDDMVLDFTMGGGSTGVACANTGRRFVGIELNPEYYAKAVDRVLTVWSDT